jgi:serine/threonine protein kinase
MIGTTLSHYRIVEKIGKGGMGEVYRAHDERLDRDVTIKVLPEEVAGDKERLARFEREAKLLASLSHQNIATLYGLEEVDLPVATTDDRGRPQHVIPRSFPRHGVAKGEAGSDEESPEARATSRSEQSPEDSGDPSTHGAEAPLAQDDSPGVAAPEEATRTIRFLVMELAEGDTLKKRSEQRPPPPRRGSTGTLTAHRSSGGDGVHSF